MICRQSTLKHWLQKVLGTDNFLLTPLAGDASFRRYYRLSYTGGKRIIMDAPPEKETLHTFITVADVFRFHGICTPVIHAVNKQQGFAILDDFGDQLLLDVLSPHTASSLYKQAITTLITLQDCPPRGAYHFPHFDQSWVLQELQLFEQWFLQAYLKIQLTINEQLLLQQTFSWLSNEIATQPLVVIHRDYHARNIMLLHHDTCLGIIDFQDAMLGPFTYDVVSLLKDCYIQWPKKDITAWLQFFYQHSLHAQQWSFPQVIRAFDLCGLQRHLKVLGVFSRLYLRDNKPNYLKDLPLTLHYIFTCLETYELLHPFYQFMQRRIQLP